MTSVVTFINVPTSVLERHMKAVMLLEDAEKLLKQGNLEMAKKCVGSEFLSAIEYIKEYYIRNNYTANLEDANKIAQQGAYIYIKT